MDAPPRCTSPPQSGVVVWGEGDAGGDGDDEAAPWPPFVELIFPGCPSESDEDNDSTERCESDTKLIMHVRPWLLSCFEEPRRSALLAELRALCPALVDSDVASTDSVSMWHGFDSESDDGVADGWQGGERGSGPGRVQDDDSTASESEAGEGKIEQDAPATLPPSEPVEHRLARVMALMAQLLDVDVPDVTMGGPLGVLLLAGDAFLALLSLVLREAPSVVAEEADTALDGGDDDEQPAWFTRACPDILASRTPATPSAVSEEELTATKRSYRAYTLLCAQDPATNRVLSRHAGVAVGVLMNAFSVSSGANFYHVCGVLQRLVQGFPVDVARALSGNSRVWVGRMMQFLHHAPVCDMVVQLVTLSHTMTSSGGAGPGAGLLSHFGVCAVPEGGSARLYSVSGKEVSGASRQALYTALNEWSFVVALARHVYRCEYDVEDHVVSAADCMIEIARFLSHTECGALLVAPLAATPLVLRSLTRAAVGDTITEANEGCGYDSMAPVPLHVALPLPFRRREAARVLHELLATILEDNVPIQSFSSVTQLLAMACTVQLQPNALTSVAARCTELVLDGLPLLVAALEDFNAVMHAGRRNVFSRKQKSKKAPQLQPADECGNGEASPDADAINDGHDDVVLPELPDSLPEDGGAGTVAKERNGRARADDASQNWCRRESVKYAGHTVHVAFGSYRLRLLELLALLVEHNPHETLSAFGVSSWRCLVAWFVEYEHNNLFHLCFSRLVVGAIRLNEESSLRPLLQGAKLVTLFLQLFVNRKATHTSATGAVMNVLNVLRLQADASPPTSFLVTFLRDHSAWGTAVPELCEETVRQRRVQTPPPLQPSALSVGGLLPTVALARTQSIEEVERIADAEAIDLGSAFASELGFRDVWPWDPEEGDGGDNGEEGSWSIGSAGDAADGRGDAGDDDDSHDTTDDATGAVSGSADVPVARDVAAASAASATDESQRQPRRRRRRRKRSIPVTNGDAVAGGHGMDVETLAVDLSDVLEFDCDEDGDMCRTSSPASSSQ